MEHRSTGRDYCAAAEILAGGVSEYMPAKDFLDVFVSTGKYLGHFIAFSQPTFMHFSPSFSSAWKLTGQWELQRNLYF